MTVTVQEAKELVIEFCRTYPVAAQLTYYIRNTVEELYGDRAKGMDMVGAYITGPSIHPGRCDFPSNNSKNVSDFITTLRHEIIGHFGLNTFTGAEKNALLNSIIASKQEPSIRGLWAVVDMRYADSPDSIKAEEIFALFCEGIEPEHHTNNTQIHQVGQRIFHETCIDNSRLMRLEDIGSIAKMVAHGLHDRTRSQKNFPALNQQFKKDQDMEKKKPFHETVAENLIEKLKEGTAPWQRPWESGNPGGFMPINPTTGKRYKGINAIHLMSQGYTDQRWVTYKQAVAVEAHVKKGERGTQIQYWKFSEEQDKLDASGKPILDVNGKPTKETVRLERPRVFFATVFNAGQIDGLPLIQPRTKQDWNAIERAEHILQSSGATILHSDQNGAFYRLSTDSIHLPEKGQFANAALYYAAALHELGHWTGHGSRLDRDLLHPFGSDGYAREELRAQIASMILGDELGVGHDPAQHVAYVGAWIEALKKNPLEIFRAAADAEKIQDYVLGLEQKQVQESTLELTRIEMQGTPLEQQETELKQAEDIELTQELKSSLKIESPTNHQPNHSPTKIFITVPFKQKDEVKKLGAKWDREQKSWYIPDNSDIALFAKWTQATIGESVKVPVTQTVSESKNRHYLAVPYGEHTAAKAAGAIWDKAAKSWYAGPKSDMTKLNRWVEDKLSGQQAPAMTPQEEFGEALRSLGCIVDGRHPIMDGTKQRISVDGDKKGEQAGFYVGHLDGHPAGYIKNNQTGIELKWKSKGYSISPELKAHLQAEASAKLQARDTEQAKLHERTAERVVRQMDKLVPVAQPTTYMHVKGIEVHAGAYTDQEGKKTYIPAVDADGKQWSMQYIQENGIKRFAKDSRKEGCFHAIGGLDALASTPALIISEGYATASSLSESLGFATVAAFDSGNLIHVAKTLHEKFPDKPIVIAGDDDKHLEATLGINPGRTKAEEAAKAVGGKVLLPIFAPDEQISNPKGFTDFNDLASKSVLGKEGISRQVRSIVEAEIEKHQKRHVDQLHLELNQPKEELPRRKVASI